MSTAEVKHELHSSPSQPVSYTSSPKELSDTLPMDPSDVKLDPSAETPAPGMLGCDTVWWISVLLFISFLLSIFGSIQNV